MDQSLIESSNQGAFDYSRFRVRSPALPGNESHYGLLSLKDLPQEAIPTTLYLFHGGNGDDAQAVQAGLPHVFHGELLDLARARHLRIVLPFIGTSFARDGGAGVPSYGRFLREELIPEIEGEFSTREERASRRLLAGFSMGGMAALSFFFRHPDFFQGVGAHFPTLLAFDHLDAGEIHAFAERTKIDAAHLEILVGGHREVYPDSMAFSSNDPIQLAAGPKSKLRLRQGARIYFDVGTEDEFALHEGGAAFHSRLSSLGIPHDYDLVKGGKHDGAFLGAQFPKLVAALLNS